MADLVGGQKKRVVIIDDSRVALRTVKDALTRIGCEVDTVSEPSSESLSRSAGADLVLIDINMPQSFGDDIARFLKEVGDITAPIYLFSSLEESELSRRTREANADGYICKAWGLDRLVAEVKTILDLPAD